VRFFLGSLLKLGAKGRRTITGIYFQKKKDTLTQPGSKHLQIKKISESFKKVIKRGSHLTS
jgi:hypothetical protein